MSTKYSFKPKIKEEEIKKLIPEKFHILFEMDSEYKWEYLLKININELPVVHFSYGWKPLWYITPYYSNIEEIKDFNEKYKDILELQDEYGEKIDLEELIQESFTYNGKDRDFRHVPGFMLNIKEYNGR